MSPRGWITAGWLLVGVAAVFAIVAVIQVLGRSPAVACIQLAGITCPGGGTQLLAGLICAVAAGVAFFSALACIFWAAHLRTLDALRALADASGGAPGNAPGRRSSLGSARGHRDRSCPGRWARAGRPPLSQPSSGDSRTCERISFSSI